jgi:hypothetical protein
LSQGHKIFSATYIFSIFYFNFLALFYLLRIIKTLWELRTLFLQFRKLRQSYTHIRLQAIHPRVRSKYLAQLLGHQRWCLRYKMKKFEVERKKWEVLSWSGSGEVREEDQKLLGLWVSRWQPRFTHTHTRHTHTHIHARTHAHTHTNKQTHKETNTQTNTHTNKQTHKYRHTQTTHTNTHTHTHTQTHTQLNIWKLQVYRSLSCIALALAPWTYIWLKETILFAVSSPKESRQAHLIDIYIIYICLCISNFRYCISKSQLWYFNG